MAAHEIYINPYLYHSIFRFLGPLIYPNFGEEVRVTPGLLRRRSSLTIDVALSQHSSPYSDCERAWLLSTPSSNQSVKSNLSESKKVRQFRERICGLNFNKSAERDPVRSLHAQGCCFPHTCIHFNRSFNVTCSVAEAFPSILFMRRERHPSTTIRRMRTPCGIL